MQLWSFKFTLHYSTFTYILHERIWQTIISKVTCIAFKVNVLLVSLGIILMTMAFLRSTV